MVRFSVPIGANVRNAVTTRDARNVRTEIGPIGLDWNLIMSLSHKHTIVVGRANGAVCYFDRADIIIKDRTQAISYAETEHARHAAVGKRLRATSTETHTL